MGDYTPFRWNESSNLMFIALRPSTEEFPSESDHLLADIMIENGLAKRVWRYEVDSFIFFEGAFITDLIKCRGPIKETPEIPPQCIDFLKREMDIVRPRKIVAIGVKTRNPLWKHRTQFPQYFKYRRREDISKSNELAFVRELLYYHYLQAERIGAEVVKDVLYPRLPNADDQGLREGHLHTMAKVRGSTRASPL